MYINLDLVAYPVVAGEEEVIGAGAAVPEGVLVGDDGDVIGHEILEAVAVVVVVGTIEIVDDLVDSDGEEEGVGVVGVGGGEAVVAVFESVNHVTFN